MKMYLETMQEGQRNDMSYAERYKDLAVAAVVQASIDYLEYKYKAEHATDTWEKHHAEREVIKIEEFFCSERFSLFSDLDGRKILSQLKTMPPKKSRRGRGSSKHAW